MMSLVTLCTDCGRCQTAIDGLQNGIPHWCRWKSSFPPNRALRLVVVANNSRTSRVRLIELALILLRLRQRRRGAAAAKIDPTRIRYH